MELKGKERIWEKYQKEIPLNDYYYARSCIRQNFWPGSEQTFIRILQDELGKNILDEKHHTTCSGIAYHCDVVPLETTMTIVARQFSLMSESGYKHFVPSCITSFGVYTEILETWHEFPEIEEKIRKMLSEATGRTFDKPEFLVHPSDVIYALRNEILQKAKYRLVNAKTGEPLKCVDHIGCHYAKMFPEKGVGGAEFPHVLVGMIEAWGGEVVDYPERRTCCGFGFRQYMVQANRGYSIACTKRKFDSMESYKPDLIVTNCPGCPYFLDRWQYVIAEMEGKVYTDDGYGIPVLTYEELAGLVLGYNPWELGLQMHQVSVEPLLEKMGYEYDPTDKYVVGDKNINTRPETPNILKIFNHGEKE